MEMKSKERNDYFAKKQNWQQSKVVWTKMELRQPKEISGQQSFLMIHPSINCSPQVVVSHRGDGWLYVEYLRCFSLLLPGWILYTLAAWTKYQTWHFIFECTSNSYTCVLWNTTTELIQFYFIWKVFGWDKFHNFSFG